MTKILALNPVIALSRNGSNVLESVKFKHLSKFCKKKKKHLAVLMLNLLIFLIILLLLSWIPDGLYAQLKD